MQSNGKAGIS